MLTAILRFFGGTKNEIQELSYEEPPTPSQIYQVIMNKNKYGGYVEIDGYVFESDYCESWESVSIKGRGFKFEWFNGSSNGYKWQTPYMGSHPWKVIPENVKKDIWKIVSKWEK